MSTLFEKTSIVNKIISCQYNSETCSENDFEFYKISDFTKCYKFNSGVLFNGETVNIRKARRYGKTYGLQLELFVGLPQNCKYPLNRAEGNFVIDTYFQSFSIEINRKINLSRSSCLCP